jgi:DNA-binding NtrC family response regulator
MGVAKLICPIVNPEIDAPIFHSDVMKAVKRTVERVAPSDETVLIIGETGTGKEVTADLIHALSTRQRRPMTKINFSALPPDLIEKQLFGWANSGPTNTSGERDGVFSEAENGSLFLDELSSLPIGIQSKLAQVLRENEYRPVGGRISRQARCRVIAATTDYPDVAFREGRLLPSLHHIISSVTIFLPPLRERREDIMPLATAFLKRFAAKSTKPITGFTHQVIDLLNRSAWPGNVRQLENTVREAVSQCRGEQVGIDDMAISSSQGSQSNNYN